MWLLGFIFFVAGMVIAGNAGARSAKELAEYGTTSWTTVGLQFLACVLIVTYGSIQYQLGAADMIAQETRGVLEATEN